MSSPSVPRRPARHVALQVVRDVLADLLEELVELEAAVRVDREDSVHALRTTIRKLRTVLSAARGGLAEQAVEDLRLRLGGFADTLEPARDAQVRGATAIGLLGPGGIESSRGDGGALAAAAREEYESARVAVVAAMDGEAHRALLADLRTTLAAPPLGHLALLPHRKVVKRMLRRELRRALRRLKAMDPADLDSLHEARKAVRRVRYLAVVLSDAPSAVRGPAPELVSSAKAVQTNLGDHRDLLLLADWASDGSAQKSDAADGDPAIRSRLADEARRGAERLERERGAVVRRFRKAAKPFHA
jgi:CHAD domain-containing protein